MKLMKVAAQLRIILLSYYHRIATHKFDIGCIDGIEYSIPIKEREGPIYSNPYNAL